MAQLAGENGVTGELGVESAGAAGVHDHLPPPLPSLQPSSASPTMQAMQDLLSIAVSPEMGDEGTAAQRPQAHLSAVSVVAPASSAAAPALSPSLPRPQPIRTLSSRRSSVDAAMQLAEGAHAAANSASSNAAGSAAEDNTCAEMRSSPTRAARLQRLLHGETVREQSLLLKLDTLKSGLQAVEEIVQQHASAALSLSHTAERCAAQNVESAVSSGGRNESSAATASIRDAAAAASGSASVHAPVDNASLLAAERTLQKVQSATRKALAFIDGQLESVVVRRALRTRPEPSRIVQRQLTKSRSRAVDHTSSHKQKVTEEEHNREAEKSEEAQESQEEHEEANSDSDEDEPESEPESQSDEEYFEGSGASKPKRRAPTRQHISRPTRTTTFKTRKPKGSSHRVKPSRTKVSKHKRGYTFAILSCLALNAALLSLSDCLGEPQN
jgi:hypothetical protein